MRYSVTFIVEIPDKPGLDHAAIRNWLEFNLGAVCSMLPSPISDLDLEACEQSVTFSRCV
jgi:hypothetical protein